MGMRLGKQWQLQGVCCWSFTGPANLLDPTAGFVVELPAPLVAVRKGGSLSYVGTDHLEEQFGLPTAASRHTIRRATTPLAGTATAAGASIPPISIRPRSKTPRP